MRSSSCRVLLRHLSVLLIAATVFYLQGPQLVRHPATHLKDCGDAILNAWIMAWDAHALTDPHAHIWDTPVFYPVANTLTFSETMFGNLWLAAPVNWLSATRYWPTNCTS